MPPLPVLALVLASLAPPAPTAGAVHRLRVDGVERAYELHVPVAVEDAARKAPAPLLLVLHGRGGSAPQIRRDARFDAEADRLGFVVAYPSARAQEWADARQHTLPAGVPSRAEEVAADVRFLVALIDDLVARGVADRERVFVAGHSNGGFMALTFACAHADKLRGVAAVAGGLARQTPGAPLTTCAPARPLATLIVHSDDDPLVPFTGGPVGPRGRRGFIRANDEVVDVFARAASCGPPTRRAPVDAKPHDGTRLVFEDRAGCTAPVVRAVLESGKHGWPGPPPHPLFASEELDATKAITRLFFEGRAP